MKAHLYNTGVGKCNRICKAMSAGTGFPIVPPSPLRDGAYLSYGVLRGVLPTLKQAQAESRTWFYCDNAYIGREKFFRWTKNAYQHSGIGDASPERWRSLGVKINPWRKSGHHILVCPPEPKATEFWGVRADWLEVTLSELCKHTDRPIRVRRKIRARLMDGAPPLEVDLRDAWAVVCWRSNVAVDALLAGVPIVCDPGAVAYPMSGSLAEIEDPKMPDDRERWACVLAANQWTIAEMADGTCWRELSAG